MKVFSLINLKMKEGIKRVPLFRAEEMRRHRPRAPSVTARTNTVKIEEAENDKDQTVQTPISNSERSSRERRIIRIFILNLVILKINQKIAVKAARERGSLELITKVKKHNRTRIFLPKSL